jgi:hypothetical protein
VNKIQYLVLLRLIGLSAVSALSALMGVVAGISRLSHPMAVNFFFYPAALFAGLSVALGLVAILVARSYQTPEALAIKS